MLSIVKVPNSILTQRARPVGIIDKKVKKIVKDMVQALEKQTDPQGVGLAAPQVGIGLQIFIMKPEEKSPVEVMINPEIVKTAGEPKPLERPKNSKNKKRGPLEGCLSIPRIWAPVKRPHKVLLSYLSLDGKHVEQWFTGFKAVIVQHEVDHLEGILFTQRALEQKAQIYEEKAGELKKMAP